MTNGTRSTATSGATSRTMASARPTAMADVLGATTRSASRSTSTARRVTRPGSPGPDAHAHQGGPGRWRAATGSSRRAMGAWPAGSDATSRSTASRRSWASERPVARATAASRSLRASGR